MNQKLSLVSFFVGFCLILSGCNQVCQECFQPLLPPTEMSVTVTFPMDLKFAPSFNVATAKLGENWFALARPLPPPYDSPIAVRDLKSEGWILLTPNVAMQDTTLIRGIDNEYGIVMEWSLDQVIITDSVGKEDLEKAYNNWYDETTASVLWMDHVFAANSTTEPGVMYTIGPEPGANIRQSPYRLYCPIHSEACIVENRLTQNPIKVLVGERQHEIDTEMPNYDYWATVQFGWILPGYEYATCNEDQKICLLIDAGTPDGKYSHRRFCSDLDCPTSGHALCASLCN